MGTWRVVASLNEDGQIAFGAGAASLPQASPVEILLAAAAACFARSFRIVERARDMPGSAIEVEARGSTAADLPGRLAVLVLAYTCPALDPPVAERIAQDAKRICTVTNSLSAGVVLERRP